MFLFFVLAGEASWARSPGGSGTLHADHGIVLEVLKQHGRALRYAAGTLQADRGIVLAAVKQDGLALEYVAVSFDAFFSSGCEKARFGALRRSIFEI